MDERISILDEIAVSGLFEVMPLQTQRVLCAMAHFADPSTRELTTPVHRIAMQATQAMQASSALFPDQVAGVIHLLCESGIVEKVSEGPPPTYCIPCYERLVEAKSKIDARIAAGEQPFPHVAPGPTDFKERRGSGPR